MVFNATFNQLYFSYIVEEIIIILWRNKKICYFI